MQIAVLESASFDSFLTYFVHDVDDLIVDFLPVMSIGCPCENSSNAVVIINNNSWGTVPCKQAESMVVDELVERPRRVADVCGAWGDPCTTLAVLQI